MNIDNESKSMGGGGQPYKSNFELSNKRILTMNPNPWGGGGGGGRGGGGAALQI